VLKLKDGWTKADGLGLYLLQRILHAMSLQEEDTLDLELQRKIEDAFVEFLKSRDADRLDTKLRHLELLRAFTKRLLHQGVTTS
jgi:hypothetical protein